MNKNRKNVDNFKKDGKDSLWKLLANQKSTDPQEKLIRFWFIQPCLLLYANFIFELIYNKIINH